MFESDLPTFIHFSHCLNSGDKLAVWTSDARNAENNLKIGRTLKQRLNIPKTVTIGFQVYLFILFTLVSFNTYISALNLPYPGRYFNPLLLVEIVKQYVRKSLPFLILQMHALHLQEKNASNILRSLFF